MDKDGGQTMVAIYRDRLHCGETLDTSDLYDVLKNYEDCLEALAYLASCNAATLETAPKSMSKSTRRRFEALNKKGAEALRNQYFGDPVRSGSYNDKVYHSYERCISITGAQHDA
jgi:hypothetical protein